MCWFHQLINNSTNNPAHTMNPSNRTRRLEIHNEPVSPLLSQSQATVVFRTTKPAATKARALAKRRAARGGRRARLTARQERPAPGRPPLGRNALVPAPGRLTGALPVRDRHNESNAGGITHQRDGSPPQSRRPARTMYRSGRRVMHNSATRYTWSRKNPSDAAATGFRAANRRAQPRAVGGAVVASRVV